MQIFEMKIAVTFLLLCAVFQVKGESENDVSIEPLRSTAKECINVCSTCCAESCSGGNHGCGHCNKGKVRYDFDHQLLQFCNGKSWQAFVSSTSHQVRKDLVGYWPMDEESGTSIADFSGHENHASATSTSVVLSKYGRGRYFNADGAISVTNSASVNFGSSSFTVAGWAKILDTTYLLTTFSVRKGFGCYFGPGREGWFPGWEIAHGYQGSGTNVCIRDHLNNKVIRTLQHDPGYQPKEFIGRWIHHAFVYDRTEKKIFAYINGKQQQDVVDISIVTGNVNNNKNLEFGQQYGWKTKGTLDEYRLYNRALKAEEIQFLYEDTRA